MKTTKAACPTHFTLYTIHAERTSFTLCFGFVNCILKSSWSHNHCFSFVIYVNLYFMTFTVSQTKHKFAACSGSYLILILLYDIAWLGTDQWKSLPWYLFLKWVIFYFSIALTKKKWVKIIFMTIFFISDKWWKDNGAEIATVVHMILFQNYPTFWSDSHCWPLRDLE